MNPKERYDSIYSSSKEHVYGNGKPEKSVEQIPEYKKSGTALDLGSGDGRNALYLASKGFSVKAFDFSDAAIEKLKKFAKEQNLSIDTEIGDAVDWSPDEKYDAIISTFVLHHLIYEDALRVIEKIKERTKPDGLNSLATFTKNGDFFKKDPMTDKFFPDEGWLKESYKDWEILSYDESETDACAKKPDGTPMRNVTTSILARKPL